MPDRAGRFQFDDGLRLAQAITTVRDYHDDKDAYSVARAMEEGSDTTGFSDEARYKGAVLKYKKDLSELDQQVKSHQASAEGRKAKMEELKAVDELGKRLYRQYQAARRSGNEKVARDIAHEFNNNVAYNGIYIPRTDEKTGKLTIVRNMTGKKETIDDLPIEQYDDMIAGYLDIPQQEMIKRMASGEQLRMQRNRELLSKAEPLFNDRGDVIYRVPAGVWDKKDSSVRGAFYIDSPTGGKEIPPEKAKGYKSLKVAKGRKDLGKHETINPKNIVTQQTPDGKPQQGLLTQGPEGPGFTPIEGGQLSTPTGTKPTQAKAAYDLKIKQLNTQLMPFNKSGADLFKTLPDGTMTIDLTDSGATALKGAMELVDRANTNPAALSPQEQQLAQYAQQAVMMYQSLSQENAQAFGLRTGPQGPGQPGADQQVSLPGNIRTTSQAVQYLMQNHGMNEEQAKNWIRSQR